MALEEQALWEKEERQGAVLYFPFSERLTREELGTYTTYGIRAMRDGKVLLSVSDVTTDGDAAVSLARLCTENDLAVEHLLDVIEDFLGSF